MDNTRRMYYRTVYFLLTIVLVTLVSATSITNIHSLQDCDIPKKRYDGDNRLPHHLVLYKDHSRKVINFTMTVQLKTLPLLINIRGYHIRKTIKAQEVSLTNVTCKNMLVTMLFELINLKYSREQCQFFEGTYSFYKMPANDIIRYWKFTKSRIGRYLYEFEFYTKNGVLLCFGATVDIQ